MRIALRGGVASFAVRSVVLATAVVGLGGCNVDGLDLGLGGGDNKPNPSTASNKGNSFYNYVDDAVLNDKGEPVGGTITSKSSSAGSKTAITFGAWDDVADMSAVPEDVRTRKTIKAIRFRL
jgi:hypothetical protein